MATSRYLFRRGWATIYLSREGWPAIHLFCRRLSICLPTYLRGYGHPPTYLGGQPPLPGRAGEPSLLIITNFPAFPLSRSSAFPLSRSSALPLLDGSTVVRLDSTESRGLYKVKSRHYLHHFGTLGSNFATIYSTLGSWGQMLLLFTALWHPGVKFCYYLQHFGVLGSIFAAIYSTLESWGPKVL